MDSFCYGVAEEVFIPDIDAHEAKLEATHARSPEDLDSNMYVFVVSLGWGFFLVVPVHFHRAHCGRSVSALPLPAAKTA